MQWGRGAGAGDAEKTASETSTKRKAPPMAILVVESSEVCLFFLFFFVCGPNKCCGNMKRVFIQLRATCSLVELAREGCGGERERF